MTQEFHISVTPVGDDEYLVRTERVEPGVPLAEEQVNWPVYSWLTQARQLMNNPLVGLLQGDRVRRIESRSPQTDPSSDSLLSLMDLGQELYGSLFQGILRDSWMTARGIAQHRGEVLRLRLGLKGGLLAKLPWEVMHSSQEGVGLMAHPLSTGTNILFSRYQPGTGLVRPGFGTNQSPTQPLRILMAIAAPTDQEQLELEREASHLQQELQLHQSLLRGNQTGDLPDIQVTILKQPGREELAQALEQGQYQILHYAGHSNLAEGGGHLYLVNRRTGLTETLSGDDLAGLLVNNGIRMAVFNSCRGAHVATEDLGAGERSLTEALVSRGIPAVLAMAEQIPDDVALTLTRLFYRNLKQGYPIDLSLSRARQGLLSAYGSNQLYWALPTLYLHPDFDGYLTTSDRTDNPADSLVRVPQLYTPNLASSTGTIPAEDLTDAALSDAVYLEPTDAADAEADAESFLLSDDDLDIFDDGYGDELDISDAVDDIDTLEDDASVVADLISQLSQSSTDATVQDDAAASNRSTAHDGRLVPSQDPSIASGNSTSSSPAASGALKSGSSQLESRRASSHGLTTSNTAVISQPRRWRSLAPKLLLLPLLGAVGVAIALAGYQFYQVSISQQPDSDLPPDETLVPDAPPADWAAIETEMLEQLASSYFYNRDLQAGESAILELLRRGMLDRASAALEAVPDSEIDDPRINFLQGRLAWESIKQGETDFSIQDARQFWEYAARKTDNPAYYNALGFALYTEGDIDDAVDAWLQALALLEQQGTVVNPNAQPDGPVASSDADEPMVAVPEQLTNQDALTAYAGISLALAQLSANPEPDQPANLLSKALKIQQMVILSAPTDFQPENLGTSWLWTDAMVREWRLLSQLRSQ